MARRKLFAAVIVVCVGALLLPLQGLWKSGHDAEAHDRKVTASTLTGSFSTDGLLANASQWFVRGASQKRIMRQVYAPFIIGGRATWTNTWGAPRYGPAPGQHRSHEGQDVFCEYGDPVLASERGTIEFENQSVGGLVARLHRPDGSYWYYAHMSAFNTAFSTGDAVAPGDIIAYCGNSGNAASTPPHVHFGWYDASGHALDPMEPLVRWLNAATSNSPKRLPKAAISSKDLKFRTKVKSSVFEGRQARMAMSITADPEAARRHSSFDKANGATKTVKASVKKVKKVTRPVIARVEKLLD